MVVIGVWASSDASTKRWKALAPSLHERTEVSAARIGNFIYVIGGAEQDPLRSSDAVERYSIKRDRWREMHPMPRGLNHAPATAYRGDLYVFGGYTDDLIAVNTLYRYRPETDRWKELPSAPTARGANALGVIGHRLYTFGGAPDSEGIGDEAFNTLEIYDFERRKWSKGPPMSVAREHLGGAVADGLLYAIGGRATGHDGNFATVERYNPRRERWRRLPDLHKARSGIAATTVDGRVVVFGGEERSGTIAEVEMYNPERRRWTSLPEMLNPRHGLGGVSLGNRVYAVEGGRSPAFSFSTDLEFLDVP